MTDDRGLRFGIHPILTRNSERVTRNPNLATRKAQHTILTRET